VNIVGWGDHEGGWKGIAVGLSADGRPDTVVFNQHDSFAWCNWDLVEKTGTPSQREAPVVYVAGGSQASYPESGSYSTPGGAIDYANGDGVQEDPAVYNMDTAWDNSWVFWPGAWGGSASSLSGPAFGRNGLWRDEQAAINGHGCLQNQLGGPVAPSRPPQRVGSRAVPGPRILGSSLQRNALNVTVAIPPLI
jgi:hypothetical protein